jgi:hypothetical protein
LTAAKIQDIVEVFERGPLAYLSSYDVPCMNAAAVEAELKRHIDKVEQSLFLGTYNNSDSMREDGQVYDVNDTKFGALVRAVYPRFVQFDVHSFLASYEEIKKFGSIDRFLLSFDGLDLDIYKQLQATALHILLAATGASFLTIMGRAESSWDFCTAEQLDTVCTTVHQGHIGDPSTKKYEKKLHDFITISMMPDRPWLSKTTELHHEKREGTSGAAEAADEYLHLWALLRAASQKYRLIQDPKTAKKISDAYHAKSQAEKEKLAKNASDTYQNKSQAEKDKLAKNKSDTKKEKSVQMTKWLVSKGWYVKVTGTSYTCTHPKFAPLGGPNNKRIRSLSKACKLQKAASTAAAAAAPVAT